MSDASQTKNESIQLNSDEGDRQVVITPEDQDRFVMSCRETIEACKLGISKEVWLAELSSLFAYVKEWADEHSSRIRSCYAIPRDGQIAIFVVPKSSQFDFELSDNLVNLDLTLAERFQVCPCDILQIPAKTQDQFEAFVNPKIAIYLYGDDIRSQETMDAQSYLPFKSPR